VAFFTITEQSLFNFSNSNVARIFPLKYIQLKNLIHLDTLTSHDQNLYVPD